jgi:hypothetical protein
MTRILLLNFTESQAAIIAKAGYTVDRGFLGVAVPVTVPEKQLYLPFQTPHPFYDYDVMVYNSDFAPELKAEFTNCMNLYDVRGCFEALVEFKTPPHVRISFLGDSTGLSVLVHGGLRFVNLKLAEQNISAFLERDLSEHSFSIPEMHRLISGFAKEIVRVGQFFDINQSYSYPYHHFRVLLSRHAEQVAAYGTNYINGKTIPSYLVLPQLKNNAKATVEIFQTLERVFPALFPDKSKNVWLESEEFMLSDEKAKDLEMEKKVAETVAIVEQMRIERVNLAKENNFIRRLLSATEDVTVDASERLSAVVKKALEFLGFSVLDIDQKTKTAIKKEDFWVSDGDFFAITEVTGTVNVNPKTKEYNDILGRMTTIFRRRTDLIPEGVSNLTGLLVLNYDCERHPSKRPKAYAGDLEHIIDAAVEQSIGILSTVELHKIIVDVKEGRLTKDRARSILKKFGRIEYITARAKTSDKE